MKAQSVKVCTVYAHLQTSHQPLQGVLQGTAVYLNCYEILRGEKTAVQILTLGYEQLQQQWRRLDAHWQGVFWQMPSYLQLKRLTERE